MIVADTCLVFHLFNETDLTTSAQKVLDKDSHWLLPPLWKEEYANVISTLARKELRPISEVIKQFDYTVNELMGCEVIVETKKALEVSIRYKISVYDAHFIVLAIDFNTLVVTEDKEILKNCPNFSLNLRDFLAI